MVIKLAKLFNAEILLFGFSVNQSAATASVLQQKAKDLTDEFSKHLLKIKFAMAMGANYAEEILKHAGMEHADLISVETNRTHSVNTILRTRKGNTMSDRAAMPVLSIPIE